MNSTKFLVVVFLFHFFNSAFAEGHPDLRQMLNAQINNNIITIPKGTYTLDLISGGAFTFSNKKNVTINGNGSTIICNKQNQAFNFVNCENTVFSNFKIEYDPPCFTQGTITSISTDKRTWNITLHDGYPTTNIKGKVQAFSKTTLELAKNFTTVYNAPITQLSTKEIRVTVPANNAVQVGDYAVVDVVAAGSGIQAHGIILNGCKNMVLDSIVMYDANSFSFFEYDCTNTHYYRCVVTRKQYDAKYSIQPLRAGSADGIHSKYAYLGPTIEECQIEYMGDDCIAINGNLHPVYNVDATNKKIYFLSPTNFKMSVGDSLVCINNNGSIRGKTVITAINTAAPSSAQITACYSKLVSQASQFSNGYVVTVDNWIQGLAISDVGYSNNRVGSGFKVINNRVGHNRSRAILIKASDGLIKGNAIVGSSMSAIVLGPEFYWMEGGCPSNVEIAYNMITNCMFEATMSNSSQAGAISVTSFNPAGTNFSPSGSLNNISIHNNTINGCPRPCVVLSSINGVNYYNNSITPDLTMIRNHGSNLGVPNTSDFWRIYVTNFSVVSNIWSTSINQPGKIRFNKNGILTLSDMQMGDIAQLVVFDMTGKIQYSDNSFSSEGTSLTFLAKGTYCISISYNSSYYSGKIIIN